MNTVATSVEYNDAPRGSARRLLFKIGGALLFSLAMVVVGSLL